MNKEDGGPAFPRSLDTGVYGQPQRGMTLRQWFAGMAMMGSSANPKIMPMSATEMAEMSYEQADAMLKEGARQDERV